jgi:hypothetical protein
LKFNDAVDLKTKESLSKFYKEYPNYFKINLIDSLYFSLTDENSIENLNEYLSSFPKGKYSSKVKIILSKLKINQLNQYENNRFSSAKQETLDDTWSIYFSDLKGNGKINDIVATDDSGCAFTTFSDIYVNDGMSISEKRIFKLNKVNRHGELEWEKEIPKYPSALALTKQNKFFIATENKLRLYDSLGDLQIEKDISSTEILDFGKRIANCFNEDEIILVGNRGGRAVVIKLDMQLNIIASHIFGDEPKREYYSDGSYNIIGSIVPSQINSIAKSKNGSYFFTGTKQNELWIGELNMNLEPLWEKNNYTFRQNGGYSKEGNTILCEGENNIFVSLKYSNANASTLLISLSSNGDVLWEKTFKGQLSESDNHVSLMKFNNLLFLITFDSDGYSTYLNPLYSKLYKVNFQGRLVSESNINVNGDNILAFNIVSSSNNYFVLGRNDNKNKEFYGKSFISKFNSNCNIGLKSYVFSEQNNYELSKSNVNSNIVKSQKKIVPNPKPINKLISFNEIKFNLMDATYKKAKSLLGEPDKDGILYMGSETKRVYIYKNKVKENGEVKHLVLCFRDNRRQAAYVQEIYAIRDNEKAYYGIHWVKVNKGVFSSNSYDFDY